MSVSTITASQNSSLYGSTTHASTRHHFRTTRRNHLIFGAERQFLWHQCLQHLPFKRHSYTSRQQNMKVEAGWFFTGGGGQGQGASSEWSDSANEDILIFFYQLEMATRVQYALNLEEYDIAKQLREKLTEVETAAIKQLEVKRGSSSKSEAQDMAISILRLRADLQNAVENENYSLAAELRDQISKLEADSLASSVKAQAFEKAEYVFRLGQKVRHKKFGYRAVVCGMDPVCCESNSWMENANVAQLSRGPDQPYYQVLVDVHEDPNVMVAYVPQENLEASQEPDMKRFDHPYTSFLFYGVDSGGDFIPVKQLREKYNRPRHEVPYDPQDEKPPGKDA